MTLAEIQIRDPFVLPVPETGDYYLFGTTDKNCWQGPGGGFDAYRSRDLQTWEGPIPAFRPPPGFWATTNFWAPEAHRYAGRFYLLASFKATDRYRGTQVLVADRPEGPYEPLTDGPVTPPHWHCLDGTLHIDESGSPWMVFCHEWLQVHDGGMYAMRLSEDLRRAEGTAACLFSASEAPWGQERSFKDEASGEWFPAHITDGPFLHRTASGALLMLWSSFGVRGYAMGVSRSATGTVQGPWTQDAEPIWAEDGGHGMIFCAFDGRLFLSFHQPNVTPNERAVLWELVEIGDSVQLLPAATSPNPLSIYA